MAEAQGVIYGPKADQQIRKTVREVSRRMMNEQPHRGRVAKPQRAAKHHSESFHIARLAAGTPIEKPTGQARGICTRSVIRSRRSQERHRRRVRSRCTVPASQLTGTGVYVTARDVGSLVVPLIEGTDCLLTNMATLTPRQVRQSGRSSTANHLMCVSGGVGLLRAERARNADQSHAGHSARTWRPQSPAANARTERHAMSGPVGKDP